MKAYVLDPLALYGMLAGYSRPLDRHDFDGTRATNRWGNGGHIPGWAHEAPNVGEMKRHANVTISMGHQAAAVDIYSFGTTQKHPLGTMAVSKDGRIYRYATAGATAVVAGSLYQTAAPIANHLNLTSAAQAIGDGTGQGSSAIIVVTPGGTGGAANLYAEGTLNISVTPGNGYNYRINGHPAITSSTAFNLFLDPDDTIQVALTSSSRYGLHHNPWKNVIVVPTTATAKIVGVGCGLITGNGTSQNYGWVQSRGVASVLINGTPTVQSPVVPSATTAGAVDIAAVGAVTTMYVVGFTMQTCVSTENDSVFLQID